MSHFYERTVRITTLPPALALYIQFLIDSLREIFGFGAKLGSAHGVASPFEQVRNKAHGGNIARIHSRRLMQIRAHHFQQILDLPIVGETVGLLIELLP